MNILTNPQHKVKVKWNVCRSRSTLIDQCKQENTPQTKFRMARHINIVTMSVSKTKFQVESLVSALKVHCKNWSKVSINNYTYQVFNKCTFQKSIFGTQPKLYSVVSIVKETKIIETILHENPKTQSRFKNKKKFKRIINMWFKKNLSSNHKFIFKVL